MLIIIKKEDIHIGKPQDPCNCAAAVAIRRETGINRVTVCHDFIGLISEDLLRSISIHTPQALKDFIAIHDAGGVSTPISFNLDISDESLVIFKHGKASKDYSDFRAQRLQEDRHDFISTEEVNSIDPTSNANADAERSIYHGGTGCIEELSREERMQAEGITEEDIYESDNPGNSYPR